MWHGLLIIRDRLIGNIFLMDMTYLQAHPLYISISRQERGHYSLHINAKSIAAKRYICVERSSTREASAEIIVLESHPTCNAICGADYVNLTCEIHFHGNWAPAMEWRQCDDNDEIVITADVEYYTYPDERVVSTLTLRHNVIDKGSCHRITAFFTENGRPIGTDADNVPSYKYTTLFNQSSEMCGFTEKKLYNSAQVVGGFVLLIVASNIGGLVTVNHFSV